MDYYVTPVGIQNQAPRDIQEVYQRIGLWRVGRPSTILFTQDKTATIKHRRMNNIIRRIMSDDLPLFVFYCGPMAE